VKGNMKNVNRGLDCDVIVAEVLSNILYYERRLKSVLSLNILDYNFLYNLYISETCIFH